MILGVFSVSKTEPWISSYWSFTQTEMIELTSKNVILNRNLFANSKTVIGFMTSKWVWRWSRLIPSPCWSCMQNKAKIKLAIYRLSWIMWLFENNSKYRHIIYCWKSFFATSMDSRSFPQNKAPFGWNQLSKFCHFAQKSVLTIRILSSRTEGTITTKRLCWAF